MSKLKIILSSIGGAIVAAFCFIFHIQRNKINNLKAENKAKEGSIENYKTATDISSKANQETGEVKSNEKIKSDWYNNHPTSN